MEKNREFYGWHLVNSEGKRLRSMDGIEDFTLKNQSCKILHVVILQWILICLNLEFGFKNHICTKV